MHLCAQRSKISHFEGQEPKAEPAKAQRFPPQCHSEGCEVVCAAGFGVVMPTVRGGTVRFTLSQNLHVDI